MSSRICHIASMVRALRRWLAVVLPLLALGIASGLFARPDPAVLLFGLGLVPCIALIAQRAARLAKVPFAGFRGRTAVIVGAHALGRHFRDTLAALPGIRICGFFDDRSESRLGISFSDPLLGTVGDVATYSKRQHVDVVYIALPMARERRVVDLVNQLMDTTASVYFVPDVPLLGPMPARVEKLLDTPVVQVCETPFLGINGMLKRSEDLILGTLLLLACLPVMLIVAAAIRLDSHGPVLFKQRRHGLDGKEIIVYKFRTMTVLEDGSEISQARWGDPRITRVGTLLRRYSLDELPQLINVLQGRMSLVGPRPHAVAHNELYRKLIAGYMIRHKVRPGITGWAQVNGLRGETDRVEKMRARVEHDIAYLREWSLALDMAILLRTVWEVVWPRNAY